MKALNGNPASISDTRMGTYDVLSKNVYESVLTSVLAQKIQNHDREYCGVSASRGLESWKRVNGLCTYNTSSLGGPSVSQGQILAQARKLRKQVKLLKIVKPPASQINPGEYLKTVKIVCFIVEQP